MWVILRKEKYEAIDILSSLSGNFYGQDSAIWSLTPSGIYTVRSMYLFFMNTGFSIITLLSLWDLKMPLKIKCFMWLVKIKITVFAILVKSTHNPKYVQLMSEVLEKSKYYVS
jgi:hypothetical protein